MRIILLERVAKLGLIGDIVDVKPGFARNFLIPQNKAAPATPQHIKLFEKRRTQIEAHNLETKNEASKIHYKLKNVNPVIITKASETGQLYGSVKARDIALILSEDGVTVSHKQINITPIKTIGVHPISIKLHPEVSVDINLCVATNEEEALNLQKENKKENKKTDKKSSPKITPQEVTTQEEPAQELAPSEDTPPEENIKENNLPDENTEEHTSEDTEEDSSS